MPLEHAGDNAAAKDVPNNAKILLVGDSTVMRTFDLAVKMLHCKESSRQISQINMYPKATAGIRAGIGRHMQCERGIQLWSHVFIKMYSLGSSINDVYSETRGFDQFDFSYFGRTRPDLVVLNMGVHFTYYDPDTFGELVSTFLPVIRRALSPTTSDVDTAFWFMVRQLLPSF